MREPRSLPERLAAAGVEAGAAADEAWRRLRSVEGPRATIIDLYALVAGPRGLAAHELPLAERIALSRSVMPDVWPGFEVTADSLRSGELIRIVDYDPGWPVRFDEWRKRLQLLLGETAIRIEHVGSTSVPGLPAKPIIDIQISVHELGDESRYVPQLEGAGVQLRSRDSLHRYFRPFPGQPRHLHVHVCAHGSAWEREHLLFRDYLRTHADARDSYAAAKRDAAAIWADDGWAFTDAKTDAILGILAEAEAWQASGALRSAPGRGAPGPRR